MSTCTKTSYTSVRAQSPAPGGRYHSAVIAMHWLTLALLIGVYAFIEFKDFFPKGSGARAAMQAWHATFGLTVFGLVFLRLLLRGIYRDTPAIDPPPPRWQQALAKVMHVTLYAFLIVMPLLGWFLLSAKGQLDLPLGLHLAPLIGPDKPLAKNIQNVHETIGNIGYYLIGLHALAALFHHYVQHDNTLWRMLPLARLGRGE